MMTVSRRVLAQAYADYERAERRWQLALAEAAALVPGAGARLGHALGRPGSRLRRCHLAREAALHRLMIARLKHHNAKARLAAGRLREIRALPPPRRADRIAVSFSLAMS